MPFGTTEPEPRPATENDRDGLRLTRPAAALVVILAGVIAQLLHHPPAARLIWMAGLVVIGLPLILRTLSGILRGHFAADLVASLAILTALLLVEPLAGLVVALMQTGGEALEALAARRATRAVRELEAMAPRLAHRLGDSGPEDVPSRVLLPGDRFQVRPGEMVPCDGMVESGEAAVNVSSVTGEPVPVHGRPGVTLLSGSLVVDGPLILRSLRKAEDSLYEQVVALVRTAQASKAPFQRMADRAAVWFTPLTLALCVIAWLWSGDVTRVLSVLVVATPCPLLLAAPIAFVGGINRAARKGIVIRHGGAIEALATIDAVLFDKTGTVTTGEPALTGVRVQSPWLEPEVLTYAAAVEAGTGHPLARSITAEARERGLPQLEASAVRESPGRGVSGVVAGRQVVVGSRSLILETMEDRLTFPDLPSSENGEVHTFVTVDRRPAAVLGFQDRTRPGLSAALGELSALGMVRLGLVSGDHQSTTEATARGMGFTDVTGDLLPQDKLRRVVELQGRGHRVLMVGDGINDAPGLSAATVGMAVARGRGGIAAEAADVVLLHPDPLRIPVAIRMARQTLRIARQSVGLGLGLSALAMGAAAAGMIPPVPGALVQEGIDLAVILNALRAAPWRE